jgi:hypothetical protein
VSKLDQMAGDLAAAIQIIVIDRIPEVFRGLVIDHHSGKTVLKQLASLFCTE